MEGTNFGKWLIIFGFAIVFVGVIVWLIVKAGIPLGKLPGDVLISKSNFSIWVPLVSSIVLSVVLTVIINLIIWLMRK